MEANNEAAMRDVLVDVYNILEKLQPYSLHIDNISVRRAFRGRLCRAKNIIDFALSKPPRNCDRFGGDEDKLFDCYIQERKFCKYKDLFPDYGFWLLKTAKTKGESDGK